MKSHMFTVTSSAPERLDKYIAANMPEVSRAKIRQQISQGAVYVNGKRCCVCSRLVRNGNKLRVHLSQAPAPPRFEIRDSHILSKDLDFIIVAKPAGIPSQPTVDSRRDNIADALLQYLKREQPQPYVGLHHRLDRDTSGVLLFSARRGINRDITNAFRERTVRKEYLAIVEGKPEQSQFSIKLAIAPKRGKSFGYTVVQSGGKSAHTDFELLATTTWKENQISLIRALPQTGRTHQIRLHLEAADLPILGDSRYGANLKGAPRVMLHAWKLSLIGRRWKTPLPKDRAQLFPMLSNDLLN